MNNRIRILIVDDTILYRKIISDALVGIPGVEIVGVAHNGKVALSKMKTVTPDLLTLDIEMPEMNGIEVLETLQRESLAVGVIVLSSLTVKGGALTLKALELGAFDFITKPEGKSVDENRLALHKQLAPLIKAYMQRREIKEILQNKMPLLSTPAAQPEPAARPKPCTSERICALVNRQKSEVIGIGISTGGPNALTQLLPQIPHDINVPILIVQHMPPLFTRSLADSLNGKCPLRVKEAENGEHVEKNTVYIAPGGKQMKVALGIDASAKIIRVTDDPPENNCKPSVDYLFRSLAHHYVGRATGVIMTGMGNDGTVGLKLMKRSGAVGIAQDEASSVVFGMPREAIQAGAVDIVASLNQLATEILKTLR